MQLHRTLIYSKNSRPANLFCSNRDNPSTRLTTPPSAHPAASSTISAHGWNTDDASCSPCRSPSSLTLLFSPTRYTRSPFPSPSPSFTPFAFLTPSQAYPSSLRLTPALASSHPPVTFLHLSYRDLPLHLPRALERYPRCNSIILIIFYFTFLRVLFIKSS